MMALALGKLTTGTPKFRGSGFVGMHVKPITAQEKFNFPRANAILARAQALLWVRDWLAGRCQAEAARNGLRPLLVKSRFMRTERTQNSDWSEVPLELISYKYLTRTTFRNVILKLAFNQWRIKP